MDVFRFKHFVIHQDESLMRVNTDGVLLGAWVQCDHPENILDIGCGTGVIALMMAQRFPDAKIDAIDNNERAAKLSQLNFTLSSWADRLHAIHIDLSYFRPPQKAIPYDLIISNPPFFNNSTPSANQVYNKAKHTSTLTHTDLIDRAYNLLDEGGCLAIILPPEQAKNTVQYALEKGFYCSRRLNIFPDNKKEMVRQALQFIKSDRVETGKEESLEIRSGSPPDFSPVYKDLTKEFYLKF